MSPFMDLNDTDAHEQEKTWQDLVLLRALLPYIKPHWKPLLASVLLLPLISLFQVLQPVLIKRAIDGPIVQHDYAGVLHLAGLFLLLLLAHYALRYGQMVLAQVTGQRIILSLRVALYNHLQRLPLSFYHKTPLGKLVTRISSDVENISEVFSSGGIAIFSDMAVIIGILIAMVAMNVPLALVVMTMIPMIVLTMLFFQRKSRSAYNEIRVQLAQVNSFLQENLTGIDVIQLLRREHQNQNLFRQLCHRLMQVNLRSVVYDSAFTAAIEVLSLTTILLIFGVIVWQHGLQNSWGITFGVLIAFLQYVQMLFEPIEEISDKFTVIQSGLASLEKIMELMDIPPEILDPPHPVPLLKAKGRIQLENVWFGYQPDRPVLKNISLEIRPGEKVALIGATGAGKSTLIKLINRQYDPQVGRVLLDGVDIREYALADLRRNIGVIPQEEFLFSRTLADNITLTYNTQVGEKALSAVIQQVHADQIIQALPAGVYSTLPERGRNLSNGERQLLVFARVLWHQPAIIMLDEATSAIDPRTEERIQAALQESLKDRTAIIIAHRLSTIEQVDTVYLLAHGEVQAFGSAKDMLGQIGYYLQTDAPKQPDNYNSLQL